MGRYVVLGYISLSRRGNKKMGKGTDLSQLQIAVLGLLLGGELKGRDLRAELQIHRRKKSAPAFYQMMSRIEDSGLVKGKYSKRVVGGQQIRERSYRITAAGRRAHDEASAFLRPFLLSFQGAN